MHADGGVRLCTRSPKPTRIEKPKRDFTPDLDHAQKLAADVFLLIAAQWERFTRNFVCVPI